MKQEEIEVMQRIIELSRTGLEAMEHIQNKIIQGHLETTITLFEDVFNAYIEIERAIKPILPKIESNDLENATALLQEGFKLMLAAYEKEKDMRPIEIMETIFLPRYKNWQESLEKSFATFILS